nr:MAG: putative RNA-dependent RNA polymerase [Mitoviridae sp.]
MYCCNEVRVKVRPLATEYFQSLNSLISSRGMKWSVRYVKMTRLCVTRFISGSKLERLEGVKLRDGWPMWINNLKTLLSNPEEIRVLLTLLTVLRHETLSPELDIQPIISGSNYTDPNVSRSEHKKICRELGISKRSCRWSHFHMSTKKGPNAQAIWSSVFDLSALPEQLIKDITLIAGSPLREHIDSINLKQLDSLSLSDIWLELFPIMKDKKFRKLSFFSDKEGKTRVIAILDYWSQTALKPLHDSLNTILKKIRTDCTFDQNRFLEILPKGEEITYHSLDLSNATDRMPITFQKRVIGSIIGNRRAEAWASILTHWPYPCKEYPDGIKYTVGQPMGAYSSWPALALTHHYIVKLAALRVGKSDFWNYCLLGDDIVIADTSVADSYRLILKQLDMPVSESKTHTSKDVYEFAKRWVYQGVEVTPFAIGGLLESWNKYPYLFNFLDNQEAHGWRLPRDRHPELIRNIYRLKGKPQQAIRTIKLYMLFGALSDMKKTGVFNSSAFKVLEQYLGFPSVSESESTLMTEKFIKEIRIQLLQSDMEICQTGLAEGMNTINKLLTERFPGLDAPKYRQLARSHLPIIMAVNDKVDASMETLMLLFDPEVAVTTLLELQGLGKYNVSKETFFNLRSSRAMLLAFSRLVKIFIEKSKDYFSKTDTETT